jgi:hypothetical protein
MAHVHGEKMVEVAKKVAEESCPFHAAGEMMGKGAGMDMGNMMKSGMGGMMGSGMGGMMEHGAGMGGMTGMGGMMGAGMEGMKDMGGMMMGSGTASGMMTAPRAVAAGAATGAAVTAARHSLFRRVVTHPLVLFGAGLAIGYLIHKYREEIIQKAGQAAE